jgi:negative regulator of sigma E activity
MKELDDKLSLLLDDYPGENADVNLDKVIGDVNLQYRMRRYQMIGEVIRHELPPAIDTGFHASVMGRIREELETQGSTGRISDNANKNAATPGWAWFKPFAGLAVAASVAVVTVALWQPLEQDATQPGGDLVSLEQQKIQQLAGQQIPGSAVTVSTSVPGLGTRWKLETETPGLQQKLNGYLISHTEYSNSMQGLIPQARVAGFDTVQ